MPAYRAFGLVVDSNLRIPALDGVALPGSSERPDISITLFPPRIPAPPGATSEAMVGRRRGADEEWHESIPDAAGDVLRVTRSPARDYRFTYSDGAEFLVSADGRRVDAGWPESLSLDDVAVYLLGPIVAFVLRMHGTVCLHASAVAAGEGCFAVLVPGGHGKSTTAAACARRGLAVLSDDVLALHYRDDEFWVTPTYPVIRLWPEAVEGLFGSADALPLISPDHPDWDKRFLDLSAEPYAFQSTPLPLRAIYTHGREEGEPPTFETLTASEALVSLVGNVYSLTRPEPAQRAREFSFLDRLARTVPMKRYRGRYGLDHVDAQCALLHADCLQATSAAVGRFRSASE